MPDDLLAMLEGPDIAPPWVVPDFLVENEIVVLAGEAGAGKSILSYALAIALATGNSFLTRQLTPTRVLYCDEENPYYTRRQYLRWAWRGLGAPRTLLRENLRVESLQLTNAGPGGWNARLARMAQEHQARLIIVDTTTPACHIVDENDNGEATRAVTKLRGAMLASPGSSMIVLRHARQDPESGKYKPRGASAWVGATDGTILHSYIQGAPATKDPEKVGLRNTRLTPAKVRAFGLRTPIWIVPRWTGPEGERGIELSIRQSSEEEPSRDAH